jgi:4-amino-4-deoxy-L-arabinose transferase-like glycosyltransferase
VSEWISASQWKLIGLLLVVALTSLFRIYGGLEQVPPAFFPDEANMAIDAQSILEGHLYLVTPHEGGEGALYAYLLALTFAMFGAGILQARMLSALISVISAAAAFGFIHYLLLPRLGRWPTLAISTLTGLGLAVANWYVAISRQAFPQPLAVLVQVACLAAVWWSLHSARPLSSLAAGTLLGLTAYTYVPGKLTPILLLLYFLLDWAARGQRSFFRQRLRHLISVAIVSSLFYIPLLFTLVSRVGEVGSRAGQFTVLSPTINRGDPWGTLLRSILGNIAGFLPFIRHLGEHSIARAMDDLTASLFLIGVIVALWRWRRPEFLLLSVWWGVMLVPSIIAPEGAMPHLRRAIGTVVPTFALAGLGLVIPLMAIAKGQPAWRRWVAVTGVLIIAGFSVLNRAQQTYANYYLRVLNNESIALTNHIYDFELAEVMALEGNEKTGYVLPVDSASGALFPESSTLAFLYHGRSAYDYIWDDEATLFSELGQLAAGKSRIGVVRWKVGKHTGADPKRVFDYTLQKWGTQTGQTQHKYFDVDYFNLDTWGIVGGSAASEAVNVSFEGNLILESVATTQEVAADDLLWVELGWRKAADFSDDYQVAIWLEDEAGHRIGQVDRPLMSNLWHRGTGEWAVGTTERDYYLIPIDPAAPPGPYQLKAVVYSNEGEARRLAPSVPGAGADLAITLGEVTVKASSTPPDLVTLPILKRLDLEVGDGLRLLGIDPGIVGPLRPGDRATLSLWWQAIEAPSRNLAVIIGMGRAENAWPLSELCPLGGPHFPTHDWSVGTVVRTFIDLRLPPDVETGDYKLGMRLLDMDNDSAPADWVLGKIQVIGRTRNFEVPPMRYSLGANFGGQVTLLGYEPDLSQVEEGGAARLTLYWQAQQEIGTAYKVFVHLLDESRQIVTQVDREPQGGETPTTGWLAGEVIVDKVEIPVSANITAVRSIAVGLYDPLTGKRVPVLSADGFPDGDHVTLPAP